MHKWNIKGSTEVQEEKTGLIRYFLLKYLWTNDYSNEYIIASS